jgi:hypothetical protein
MTQGIVDRIAHLSTSGFRRSQCVVTGYRHFERLGDDESWRIYSRIADPELIHRRTKQTVLGRGLQEVIFALGLDSGGVGSLGRGPQTLAIALFGKPTPRSRAAFELHPHRKTAAPASS